MSNGHLSGRLRIERRSTITNISKLGRQRNENTYLIGLLLKYGRWRLVGFDSDLRNIEQIDLTKKFEKFEYKL